MIEDAPAHLYHVWRGGHYQEPLTEHLDACARVGLDVTVSQISEGFEQETLNKIPAITWDMSPSETVFYAHTKGSANPSPWNTSWRRTMQHFMVDHITDMIYALNTGDYDLACIWWISENYHPNPHPQGNYWIATARYLESLPKVSMDDRWKAELWVGQNSPRVYDPYPGSAGGSPHFGADDFTCPLCAT